MSNPVLDILMGGQSFPSAEFPFVGTTVGGKVIAPPRGRQVREYDRNNPGKGPLKFYPNSGDPVMGVLIDVQAMPAMGDDSGGRRIYADNRRQKEALREALIAAGAETVGIELGGYLALTWTGEEPGEGSVAAKTWSAIYRTPDQQRAYEATMPAAGSINAYQPAQAAQPVQQTYQRQPQGFQGQPAAAAQPYQQQQYQPEPVQQYAPTPVAQPAPVAPSGPAKPRITAIQAAQMANAGIDLSQFDIVG